MMDHYEELGIERSAPVAEIRQAYRRLMQLLHPDHCADEAGRRLAELQARRLNAVLAVLTNPVERQRYDRELCFGPPTRAPKSPAAPPGHAPEWLWPAAVVAAAVALMFLIPGPRREPPAPTEPMAASAPVVPTAEPPRRPARPHPATAPAGRRQFAIQQAASAPEIQPVRNRRDEAPAILPMEPPQGELPASAPDPPAFTGAALADPPFPAPRPILAGEWLFLPQPGASRNGLYPPEFIELRVTEEGEVLRGKYRARYRVGDRAISPNVAFEFEGRASEATAQLPWVGPGGSRGEVILRLLTAGSLEVTWTVHELGNELGLISGTATLVRKLD